jgi:predicted RNase H-like nuclease (RuvC/YqgF family)
LETLRASQKNLEAKLAEAEQKISEKNSEFARKTGEFELKRQTDSDIIQKQQREIGGLRKYMETAESCWDLLNSDVMGTSSKLIRQHMCNLLYLTKFASSRSTRI